MKARDSINDNERIYEIAKLQAGFETQKKQAEIERLKNENEQQAFRRNAIAAGLIALLIIAILIVSSQRLRIRKNNQLESINMQLLSQSAQLQEQTKKLRELDPTAAVIISTADIQKSTRESAREAGALALINKPVNKIELTSVAERALAGETLWN